MSRYISCLAAALLAGMISLVTGLQAQAAPASPFSQLTSDIEPELGALTLAGHYPHYRRHIIEEDEGEVGDEGEEGEEGEEGIGDEGDGEGDEGDDPQPSCSYTGYQQKYVCESSVPRCFKQRECVWNYGREYCRYVQKCVGGGDHRCKWINVPVRSCW
jgi:hypothetical protein